MNKLPKGITINRNYPDKYLAVYWSKEAKKAVHIGIYDTVEDAVIARNAYITQVYEGEINDALPKTKGFPKGISLNDSGKFQASLQIYYGKNKSKYAKIHIGMYDTIEEAVIARLNYIERLK